MWNPHQSLDMQALVYTLCSFLVVESSNQTPPAELDTDDVNGPVTNRPTCAPLTGWVDAET